MKKFLFSDPSKKKLALTIVPYFVLSLTAMVVVYKYVNPAPPSRIVISTGKNEGDFELYAGHYREIIRKDGVTVEIRPSTGARENLQRLKDPNSGVDVGFVQDGLDATDEDAGLVSLGSLYFEPMWVFYRGKTELTRFSQLRGKKLAIGDHGGSTPVLAKRLLSESGVDEKSATFLHLGYHEAAEALRKGEADAVFLLATTEDPLIRKLIEDRSLRLMNADQAEAITRHLPYLHHLVLPHGSFDLAKNLPEQDVHLVAPTATLVARDSLNPALIDLLIKAAIEVHGDAGILEKKGEFPIDKDYDFPLADEAKRYYKNGAPFWQRYLPFWVATLVDRFILVVFPLLALILPLVKAVPKFLNWRVRSRIYKRYGELKYLETQMKAETDHKKYPHHLGELDQIEDRVNHMKVPIEFTEHLYSLREHIEFVRGKLSRGVSPAAEKAV